MAVMWTPANNKQFHYASIAVWLLLSCCLAHQFGSFQVLVFAIIQIIFFAGFTSEIFAIQEEMNGSGKGKLREKLFHKI